VAFDMTKIFFTSDWHIGHNNIIKYCNRPFNSVDEMNRALLANYQAVVGEQDYCYFLGDMCMGDRVKGLPLFRQLPGKKILITGNHDLVFRIHERPNADKYAPLYYAAGFVEIHNELILSLPETTLRLYHFPYRDALQEDSHGYEARFQQYRLANDGLWLLHGHTHQIEKISGKNSIHVGVDAWDFKPVAFEDILYLCSVSQ